MRHGCDISLGTAVVVVSEGLAWLKVVWWYCGRWVVCACDSHRFSIFFGRVICALRQDANVCDAVNKAIFNQAYGPRLGILSSHAEELPSPSPSLRRKHQSRIVAMSRDRTAHLFIENQVFSPSQNMFMLRNMGIYARLGHKQLASVRSNSTQAHMNWVEFFKLRKQNKRVNVVTSAFTGFAGAFATLTYLGNVEIDVEKPIMGLDPFMVLGGVVLLGGAMGYLVGPFIGTSVFNVRNRAALTQFKTKDRVFLQRIKHNRVDPTSQSFSNPVPDYYGERIYSLESYKQWLRDCNAFRRKSKEFL